MIEYDTSVICQSWLSLEISYFLLKVHVYSIVMSDVSSPLAVSDYLNDVFSGHDGIYLM